MRYTGNRIWFFAAAAAVLAAGPALAAEQNPGKAQPSPQGQQASDVGRPQAVVPEWQYYEQRDPSSGPLAWLTFAEVVGADVASQQGEMVGEIIALVRSRQDNMFHAVIDAIDPIAGPDQHLVVPTDSLEVVGDERNRQIVLAEQARLEDMPAYNESQYEQAKLTKEGQAQQ